ncbi:type II toxin-antitoxin system YafQ family toxin [Candidatus Methanoplasma termitum]|uniref:type II toxin-antitoxin system YafQ family toxin n=1 Tax=Candidatus Methanoplasma termitum TaxID=1577791 RepID=UPI0009DD769F
MKYNATTTSQFLRDLKKIKKRGTYDAERFDEVVRKLMSGETLGSKYEDHPLKGEYSDCRECHISPDWLLIYRIWGDESII